MVCGLGNYVLIYYFLVCNTYLDVLSRKLFDIHTIIIYESNMVEKRNIVTFQIDDELAERLDDYRFENRINTRSDAIRKLLDEALKKHEKKDK